MLLLEASRDASLQKAMMENQTQYSVERLVLLRGGPIRQAGASFEKRVFVFSDVSAAEASRMADITKYDLEWSRGFHRDG